MVIAQIMSSKPEIDFLTEINSKYANLEDDLEQKLIILAEEEKKLQLYEEKLEKSVGVESIHKSCDSLEEAKKRNSEILKSFEQAKARLRSRTTYSPIETILQKAIRNYSKEYSLIPSTKKSYGPTYV